MCDHKLDAFKDNVPAEFLDRFAELALDGVVIVDAEFQILLANPTIIHDFLNHQNQKKLLKLAGKDYFEVMFGLNLKEDKDRKRAKNAPLYQALKTGEFKRKPPFPTIAASNNFAYQIETRIDHFKINGSEKRVALEFWRRMGDPEVFKNDPSFIKI